MKLYYSPGACSLSPHIALREAGLAFDLVRVDLKTKKTKDGEDFTKVNPKGFVPALQLDSGDVLTEGPAVVQFIADQNPDAALAPKAGTMDRYRLQELLNFISTELHKGFSPLFNPATPEEWKTQVKATLGKRFDDVVERLGNGPYLMGERFTVADGYLFTVLSWHKYTGIDLSGWPALVAYVGRVAARPAVQEALKAEGLLK
jgi:glutathione S-transferase